LKRYLSSNSKATDADIAKERKAIESGERNYVHRGPHRNTPTAECIKLYHDKPTTLRFKIPEGTKSIVEDLICGHCEQNTDKIGDPVILRENGIALYNFASVVDDGAMKITHVVRAREHLANTYTQVWFFQALGLPLPQFAHVPVVNEPASKKKLSKRDMKKFVTPEIRKKLRTIGWTDEQIDSRDDLNPATVAFYKEMGYLPSGLVNYLGRLGWSLDDKTEIIKLPEMIANFSLDRVNDSPASFDPDKLYWVAGEYMKDLPMEDKITGCLPYLERGGYIPSNPSEAIKQKLQKIIEACKERLKLFSDILTFGGPIFKADPSYDPKAVEKNLKRDTAVDSLKEFVVVLQANDTWDAPILNKLLHDFSTTKGIDFKKTVQTLRVAVTGTEVGFSLFDTLVILGKDETLRRIQLAFKQVAG
jgi:glutamyl/glutaminyl-tRNA synthetase